MLRSFFTIAILTQIALAQLSISLTGPTSVESVGDLKVSASLINSGSKDLKLLNAPGSVLSELPTDAFTITNEAGEHPTFIGVQVKWAPELAIQKKAWTVVKAGQTLSVTRDLSKAYNFTETGYSEYSIAPSTFFYSVDATETTVSELEATVDTALKSRISEGGVLSVARGAAPMKRATWAGCNSQEKSTLTYVAQASSDLAKKANTTLASMVTPSSLYTTWFGEYTTTRYSTLSTHWTSIAATSFSDWHYDCSTCERDDYYSFVYADDPGRIFLCSSFWDLPFTGTDSMAGTLVNEASRFTINGGTEEYASGRSACKKLATKNAGQAVMNADSHEYFAEEA
ncbi:peptidyl-Lys metalloendopeptidase [Flagelloscypha sp. PMI_526]|nr:peptidyl-Lys metalloendopeptidase [Flagelloscypha sp. PMI_526]